MRTDNFISNHIEIIHVSENNKVTHLNAEKVLLNKESKEDLQKQLAQALIIQKKGCLPNGKRLTSKQLWALDEVIGDIKTALRD